MKKINTICLMQKDQELLLGFKKRGFGQGKWNGFGGKVEVGESIAEATRRETKEESGLAPITIEKYGLVDFKFKNKPELEIEAHIFKCKDFIGELIESDEMLPKWFSVNKIPYNEMWDDDKYWLPLFLAGKKFKGKFLFDDNDKVISQEINLINNL